MGSTSITDESDQGGDWSSICDYSVVPTILFEATSFRVRRINSAAREMLGRREGVPAGTDVRSFSNPDDVESLEEAVESCEAVEGAVRYLRHRFVRRSAPDATTEMTLVGCGRKVGGTVLVLAQMRDATSDPSLAAFVRLLADDPDGNSVTRAIVGGSLARIPISLATITAADHANRRVIQVGSVGLDARSVREYRITPIDNSHPVGAAILNVETIRMSQRSVSERFPLVAGVARAQPSFETDEMLAAPILSRGIPIGGLFLLADRPMPRTWQFHETLVSVSQALAPWLLLRRRDATSEPVGQSRSTALMLSDRERLIVKLVGEGKTNLAIAEELGYSEATVRADLSRLSKMLGVSGRREVVRRVGELGL